MNENLENTMEVEETREEVTRETNEVIPYQFDEDDYPVEESGNSGKVIALVVGGLATAGAIGVGLYHKFKKNKDGEPKKKVKRRLKWVEVEESEKDKKETSEDKEVIDVEAKEVDSKNEKETKKK